MLKRGKPPGRGRPRRKAKSEEPLSPEELHELLQITREWRDVFTHSHAFVVRLREARGLPRRSEVESRLLCVLHDSLEPAIRDLEAIERTVRTPERKGR